MKNSDKFIPQGVQPYKNMPARKGVLICGLVFTLISFILMLVAVLFLFVPDVKMGGNVSPSLMLSVILGVCVALGFAGTVFAVAGANVKKSMARWSMFFGIIAFILGAGMLTVVMLLRTVLPLDAIRRLAGDTANAIMLLI